MISILTDAPENVAAFYAMGETPKNDFEALVLPHIKHKHSKFQELNYMIYLNGNVEKDNFQSLFKECCSNLQDFTNWNRTAIVMDDDHLESFHEMFATLMSGELRFFSKQNIYDALYWCHNGKALSA
ncbi:MULTISPECIES: STAS/SEC14 domain-containing protein [unclassified Chryseobacterium]|uniref:STAS/SEC14 domain-containing protein n=1 Tax=unclassified Chryseobacterium TaxID=2593645 RepID=UPI00226A108D|nr:MULTISPECIES: STAS/SEC14 domain-containing protein [unclassified Chryseobacterium]